VFRIDLVLDCLGCGRFLTFRKRFLTRCLFAIARSGNLRCKYHAGGYSFCQAGERSALPVVAPDTRRLFKSHLFFFRLKSVVGHRFDMEFKRLLASGELLEWTRLEVDRCPHCTLAHARSAHCSAAVDLVPFVERFSALYSIDPIDVQVVATQYEVRKHADAQTALRILMGLILVTSACPILERMRPLAHMHMPFATTAEMDGLDGLSSDFDRLNHAFSGRLELAVQGDACVKTAAYLSLGKNPFRRFIFVDASRPSRPWRSNISVSQLIQASARQLSSQTARPRA
jgi:hypothetical protein